MYNAKGDVIYVGKAKNLKKRVTSYFRANVDSRKTSSLVANITNIDVTLVNSDTEAFLLENNYIKKYREEYKSCFLHDHAFETIKSLQMLGVSQSIFSAGMQSDLEEASKQATFPCGPRISRCLRL